MEEMAMKKQRSYSLKLRNYREKECEYSLDLKNKLALAVFPSPLAFIFQNSASHQVMLV